MVSRWGKRAAHNRAQIIYYLAENLEIRRNEFAERLSVLTGVSVEEGEREVELSIQRLFHWAAYCDKYGGSVQVGLYPKPQSSRTRDDKPMLIRVKQ